MNRIRALIVDDEPFARERVRRLLACDDEVEVVGECPDGFRAVEAIDALRPDLLFLDVRMPGKDGFAVLDEVADQPPVVVFLTAYDQYAVRAFDACAMDYLLKPFDEERFRKTLSRAKAALRTTDERAPEAAPADLDVLAGSGRFLERLVFRDRGRILFPKVSEVDWIEASGNYVTVHMHGRAHLLRESLTSFEARLDPAVFVRIHRSTLVNLERVEELRRLFHGRYEVILRGGTRLTLSRRFRGRLERVLGELP